MHVLYCKFRGPHCNVAQQGYPSSSGPAPLAALAKSGKARWLSGPNQPAQNPERQGERAKAAKVRTTPKGLTSGDAPQGLIGIGHVGMLGLNHIRSRAQLSSSFRSKMMAAGEVASRNQLRPRSPWGGVDGHEQCRRVNGPGEAGISAGRPHSRFHPANKIPSFRELARGREDVECRTIESREGQGLR
jgi:hypothetical protein